MSPTKTRHSKARSVIPCKDTAKTVSLQTVNCDPLCVQIHEREQSLRVRLRSLFLPPHLDHKSVYEVATHTHTHIHTHTHTLLVHLCHLNLSVLTASGLVPWLFSLTKEPGDEASEPLNQCSSYCTLVVKIVCNLVVHTAKSAALCQQITGRIVDIYLPIYN